MTLNTSPIVLASWPCFCLKCLQTINLGNIKEYLTIYHGYILSDQSLSRVETLLDTSPLAPSDTKILTNLRGIKFELMINDHSRHGINRTGVIFFYTSGTEKGNLVRCSLNQQSEN